MSAAWSWRVLIRGVIGRAAGRELNIGMEILSIYISGIYI